MIAARHCFAALLVIAASCGPSSASPAPTPRVVTNPNVISREELQDPAIWGMDAVRAIRFLRPTFFRTSGPQSFADRSAGVVQFSFDFGPLQPASELAAFPPLSLRSLFEIRYLDAADAQNRFGVNANGGPVIVLLSNRQ